MVNTLRSELIKALSLRSVQLTLLAALVMSPALAFFSGLSFDAVRAASTGFPLESHGFETAGFGQPIVILLAALIVGSEYLDGQLRTSLIATPRRGRVFAAKLVVVAILTAAIATVSTCAAVLLKHAVLGDTGLGIEQFTTGMAWNLLGVIINYTLISLIAASMTFLTRSYIATLVVLVPLVLGLTISLLGALPALKFLPDLAGLQLLTSYPGIGLLEPVWGAIVMSAWACLIGAAAWWLFRARDVGSQ